MNTSDLIKKELIEKNIPFKTRNDIRFSYYGQLNDLEEPVEVFYLLDEFFVFEVGIRENWNSTDKWFEWIRMERWRKKIEEEEKSLFLENSCSHKLVDNVVGKKILKLVLKKKAYNMTLTLSEKKKKWYPETLTDIYDKLEESSEVEKAYKETCEWKLFEKYSHHYRLLLLF